MRFRTLSRTALIFALGVPLFADSVINPDQVTDFLLHAKKGTPVQLTLQNEKVVNGLFSSYDDYYDTVWIVPGKNKGLFREKGYKLSGIKNVTVLDAVPSAVTSKEVPKETAKESVKESSKNDAPTLEEMSDGDYYLRKEKDQP